MKTKITLLILIVFGLLAMTACEKSSPTNTSSNVPATTATASSVSSTATSGKEIAAAKIGNLSVVFSNPQGHFKEGDNDFTVEFRGVDGKPVDVGASTIVIDMPAMGSMPHMKNNVKLLTTNTPGVYQATTKLEMAGTWTAHVAYKGSAGEGKTDFSITAK